MTKVIFRSFLRHALINSDPPVMFKLQSVAIKQTFGE